MDEETERQIEEEWEGSYAGVDLSKLPWGKLKPPSGLVKLVDDGVLKPGNAIDLGCGLGISSIYLAQKGFDVVGLDVSKTALAEASRRAKNAGVQVRFVHGFAHRLELADESFTLVLDRGCFHHVPKELWKAYIDEVYRVLQDGGHYYLECFSAKNKYADGSMFTKKDIQSLFGVKFKIISIKEITNKGLDNQDVYLYTVLMRK